MMNRSNRPSTRSAWLRGAACAFIAAAALSGGCKKPPPPPQPPPQPPPPAAPSTVKLEDLSQELRADARVQFSPDMEVTEDRAELARAVIRLADAIAKGDAAAARALLTRQAQGVLDVLDQDGEWKEATSSIEAVRVVYIGPVPVTITAAAISADPGSMLTDFMEKLGPKLAELQAAVTAAMSALPPEKQTELNESMANFMAGGGMMPQPGVAPEAMLQQTRERLDAFANQLESAGASPESVADIRSKLTGILDSAMSMGAAAADELSDKTGVLLAIQDPTGSYLLGWTTEQAFEKWVFTNAPSSRLTKRRASEWDGIGEAGFGEMMAAAPDLEELKKSLGVDIPDLPAGTVPGSEPSPGGPVRKNTPSGPITIPGG